MNKASKKIIICRPKSINYRLLLAHGAGAPMDSPWLTELTKKLLHHKIEVIRFEFPYMENRRRTKKKQPPNKTNKLVDCFKENIDLFKSSQKPLLIGGKSLGGRIASMLADHQEVAGVICFGYPFHSPKKLITEERTKHLSGIQTPTLILQGSRDPFGTPEDLKNLPMSAAIEIYWLKTSDHDFRPLKSSGWTQNDALESAASRVANFLQRRVPYTYKNNVK